jgi:hypothetical protein
LRTDAVTAARTDAPNRLPESGKSVDGGTPVECGLAFNDAPSYRAAEAPIGREVVTGQAAIHPLLLARQRAEHELITLHRERAIQRARAVERDPNAMSELRTSDEKRAAVAGGSKCETGRCQSPGRWFDASINDRETLTRP